MLAAPMLGACLVGGSLQAEEADLDRISKEMAPLFRVVMSEERAPTRCAYSADWLNYPVPEDIAQKYLGATIHSALAPPEAENVRFRFRDIVEPKREHPDHFCDESQLATYSKAQFAGFEKDASAHEIVMEQASFTLPIFDADYRKAIVIVEHVEAKKVRVGPAGSGKLKPGEILPLSPNAASVAKIYTKTKSGWQLLDSELVGQT